MHLFAFEGFFSTMETSQNIQNFALETLNLDFLYRTNQGRFGTTFEVKYCNSLQKSILHS